MVCEARLDVNVTKMHGARNDFVVVDRRMVRQAHHDTQGMAHHDTPGMAHHDTQGMAHHDTQGMAHHDTPGMAHHDAVEDLAGFARQVCDRRSGIGADGVIAIERSSVADARMRTINADGSEAEMCGNGVRCAARWLDEAERHDRLTFETGAGTVETEILARGAEYAVRVTMGTPSVSKLYAPSLGNPWFVDLGNPHVVLFGGDLEAFDLERIAQNLQPRFPRGTNVHVVTMAGDSLRVRHWERGVGATMACGTGAVACAAVAIERTMASSPVEVFVPGGRLVVDWDGNGGALLTGPAVRVFDADVDFGDASAA